MDELELMPSPVRVVRKRVNKAPDPRFKPDISEQMDPILGSPGMAVPKGHLARAIKELLGELDLTSIERKYSSQGRRGFHPRHQLGALLYGSLLGIHHSTRLEEALKENLVLRFVAGGHVISAGRLREFKRKNEALFKDLFQQVLKLAHERGLLDTSELAVDSVRLRAHASTNAVRTLTRSKKRLAQLSKVDVATLSDEERDEHEAKVAKHTKTVQLCIEQQRTNVVLTSPSAGLMKFPSGASAPGHRATVVAAGVRERFVIDVFVDGDATDYGKLGPAILRTRKALEEAGVPLDEPMQVAADAGYFCATDLAFAANNTRWVDALIAERSSKTTRNKDGQALFGVEDFLRVDGKLVCPAQRPMHGPLKDGGQRERWDGVGCAGCGLKPQCTRAAKRTVTVDPHFHQLRDAMRARMAQPGAQARYGKRIATIEPVFSVIEDRMQYRRVTTRFEASVRAEVLLKVLAYNLKRLAEAKRLRRVQMWVCDKVLFGATAAAA